MDARRSIATLLAGVAIALAATAVVPRLAQTSAQPVGPGQPGLARGITVVGTGRASVKPDMAMIRLGVQTRAETAEQAQQANAQKMDEVVRTLKGLGIPEKDVQTSSVSLRPIYERGASPNQQRVVGYEASNLVNLRITDLSLVGPSLDQAVKAGANTAGGIRFGLQNDAEQRREALKKAVEDAQGKAEAIAEAAGRTLGAAESIVEESVFSPQAFDSARAMEAAPAAPTPIEPGELEMTATVRVVYGF